MKQLLYVLTNKALKTAKRYIFKFIYTASSVLLLAVSFASCSSNKPEEIKAISRSEEMPALILRELETIITDSGTIKYRFITPELFQYPKKDNPYTELPKGFQLTIYLSDGTEDAKIKCLHAIYKDVNQLWELNNDVEAINQKGEILNTEQLFWNMADHTLYSDKFVRITSKKEIITGTGFNADESMKNWEIRNITGILELNE